LLQIESIVALGFFWGMIFSENRFPLFRIMLERSHACAAFFRLAGNAIGFWPSGRCCLADKIASDFPASDFPPKFGLWRVS
jgi:hypothetical protein